MSFIKHAERQIARQGPLLNAFLSRADPAICSSAIRIAKHRSQSGGLLSPIDGALIAVKDNICTEDLPTSCASRILHGFESPFDATVVQRLRNAGAIILGKTNLDEFGMGSHNVSSAMGPTINPRGPEAERLSPGGSSGGSAAAVASDCCPVAIGTDTGGSVRLPAAYCQVVGFKPSYGRVSRFGVVAYANSLDTVGILGRDIQVTAEVFRVIDAPDLRDPTCLKTHERDLLRLAQQVEKPKLRIGIPREYNIRELDANIRGAWLSTARTLLKHGHEIVPVSLPTTESALAAYYILAPAEASSNLAKYDGIRYGNPGSTARAKEDVLFAQTRLEGLGSEVRRRILLGSYSLSSTAINNYFLQAQRVRRQVQNDFSRVFAMPHPLQNASTTHQNLKGVDLLLTPTAPTRPPSLQDAENRSPIEGYRDDVYTVPASLAGLPAISVPLKGEGPLSVAMQLIGQYGQDELVLRAAQLLH